MLNKGEKLFGKDYFHIDMITHSTTTLMLQNKVQLQFPTHTPSHFSADSFFFLRFFSPLTPSQFTPFYPSTGLSAHWTPLTTAFNGKKRKGLWKRPIPAKAISYSNGKEQRGKKGKVKKAAFIISLRLYKKDTSPVKVFWPMGFRHVSKGASLVSGFAADSQSSRAPTLAVWGAKALKQSQSLQIVISQTQRPQSNWKGEEEKPQVQPSYPGDL